jgi:hypothetical protein
MALSSLAFVIEFSFGSLLSVFCCCGCLLVPMGIMAFVFMRRRRSQPPPTV